MPPLLSVSNQVSIYLGIPVLVCGTVGGLLIIIVFLSLRTFRQSSCAFYLTIMSICNVGQLMTGLLTRIMINGFDIDWTASSLFYCKFRNYCLHACALLSLICYCLATVDQYCATCSNLRWQQWCHIRIARRLCAISLILSLLYSIPYLLYYEWNVSETREHVSCTIVNPVFSKYVNYVHYLFLTGSLPMIVSGVFGLLAYRNIEQLSYRRVPLVRRELDMQLTKMVLCQVILNVCAILPYVVVVILLQLPINSDTSVFTSLQFVHVFTIHLSYSFHAVRCERRRLDLTSRVL